LFGGTSVSFGAEHKVKRLACGIHHAVVETYVKINSITDWRCCTNILFKVNATFSLRKKVHMC